MRLLVGVCFVAACGGGGDSKQPVIDAPAQEDAAQADASGPGVVSISIFEGLVPRAGVRVVFQAVDSTVVLDTSTGTDGKASAMMLPGGYVTAIDPFPDQNGVSTTGDVRTFAGVKPGDRLKLFQRPFAQTAITMNVIVPADAAASGYFLSTNCDHDIPVTSGTNQIVLTGCSATTNVLLTTADAETTRQKQIYRQSAALANGGTIDLSTETYTTIPDVMFAYANVPAGYTSAGFAVLRGTALGLIFSNLDGISLAQGAGSTSMKVPAISGAVTATTATGFSGPAFTAQTVLEWGAPTTTYNLDPSGLFLPEFGGPPTLDIPNHAVKWTMAGGAVQPDYVHVRASLHRPTPSMAWRWEIVAPAASQAVFPVLPDASMYNVKTDDFGSYEVRTGTAPGGYDAVRATILAAEMWPDFTVGTSGKLMLAYLVEPGA